MSEVFDPHNVGIFQCRDFPESDAGVVDELDYKMLLLLYDDARPAPQMNHLN